MVEDLETSVSYLKWTMITKFYEINIKASLF